MLYISLTPIWFPNSQTLLCNPTCNVTKYFWIYIWILLMPDAIIFAFNIWDVPMIHITVDACLILKLFKFLPEKSIVLAIIPSTSCAYICVINLSAESLYEPVNSCCAYSLTFGSTDSNHPVLDKLPIIDFFLNFHSAKTQPSREKL